MGGGRTRKFPINNGDDDRLREYSQPFISRDSRLFTVKPDSVNKYLKDACHQLGIHKYDDAKTEIHAIQKMVAKERYDEQRLSGLS